MRVSDCITLTAFAVAFAACWCIPREVVAAIAALPPLARVAIAVAVAIAWAASVRGDAGRGR